MAPAPATTGAHSVERRRPHAEQGHVDAAMVGPATSSTSTPSRTWPADRLRGEKPQTAHREPALGQDLAHDPAHLAGRAVDPTSSAITGCPRRPARRPCEGLRRRGRQCPPATTHVRRIADVEIISMFIPSAASTSNIVADTPG